MGIWNLIPGNPRNTIVFRNRKVALFAI